MGDKFNETIFLKEDSIQDVQYESAKKNPFANKEDRYMLEKGIAGEKQVMYHLKKSNIGMYALRDIYLTSENNTAQIDFILVTSHHCYFVECKNYDADIVHVDEACNFVLSTRYGKKYNRMGIQSPLSQVDNQLNVLQKICLNKEEETKELLKGVKFKDYFKTLVVFTNPNNILELKKAPNDVKYRVLKVDNLVRQIEYDDSHYKGKRLSPEEMKNIADFILGNITTRTVYIVDKPIPTNGQSRKQSNALAVTLISIGASFMVMLLGILCLLWWANMISRRANNNQNNTTINDKATLPVNKSTELTDNQKKAFSILSNGYKKSTEEGFSIIHTSVCNEISGLVDNKMSCAGNPMVVNYKDDDQTITILKSFNCYTFTFNDNDELIDTNVEYVGYDTEKKCSGIPVGIIEWDEDNEYYNKIGGYNKLKEMSIYAYKNGNVYDYYDYSHVEERGGTSQLTSTYRMIVDRFFSCVTGTHICDTTSDKFNEMVNNYYYIMK